jgi:hypothetical protein
VRALASSPRAEAEQNAVHIDGAVRGGTEAATAERGRAVGQCQDDRAGVGRRARGRVVITLAGAVRQRQGLAMGESVIKGLHSSQRAQ